MCMPSSVLRPPKAHCQTSSTPFFPGLFFATSLAAHPCCAEAVCPGRMMGCLIGLPASLLMDLALIWEGKGY